MSLNSSQMGRLAEGRDPRFKPLFNQNKRKKTNTSHSPGIIGVQTSSGDSISDKKPSFGDSLKETKKPALVVYFLDLHHKIE